MLDTKLDMTIIRLENSVRYVQLKSGERNLNTEIQALIDPVSREMMRFSNRLTIEMIIGG